MPEFTRLQRAKLDISNSHPPEFLDEPPEMFEHDPNLLVTPFDELDFVPGIFAAAIKPKPGGSGTTPAEGDPGAEPLFVFRRKIAIRFNEIRLGHVAAGCRDGVGELAVVR